MYKCFRDCVAVNLRRFPYEFLFIRMGMGHGSCSVHFDMAHPSHASEFGTLNEVVRRIVIGFRVWPASVQ